MRFIVPAIIGAALLVGILIAFRRDEPSPPPASTSPHLLWVFEAPRPGSVVAEPCVTADAIFLAAAHTQALQPYGAVYAINPQTGKQTWTFDANGEMLPTASTPIARGGRLIFGEGMHANFTCRLRALDASTGHEQWSFIANDHIEGGPAICGGNVIFPAGNDGVYAVNLESGKMLWNFRADLHIDSTACIAGNRAYIGGGKSRRFANYQVVCLDAASGRPIWRTPVNLPAWGSPRVTEGKLFIGLGNGRLNESAQPPERPAGALACFDCATGRQLWSFATGDAVFGAAAIVDNRVIFGSRDGNLYGASLDGNELFRVPMNAPIVAGVIAGKRSIYAVSTAGLLVCLRPDDGKEVWRRELAAADAVCEAFAGPVISGNRLYVAAEIQRGKIGIVSLFCFDIANDQQGEP